MDAYLYNLQDRVRMGTPQYGEVQKLFDRHHVIVESGIGSGSDIISSIMFSLSDAIKYSDGSPVYRSFYLSEFPGNCSSLVLHHIQTLFDAFSYDPNMAEDILRSTLNFAEDLSILLKYALLFVTSTSPKLVEKLVELGYEVIPTLDSVMNPHSGHDNTFLVKRINKS